MSILSIIATNKVRTAPAPVDVTGAYNVVDYGAVANGQTDCTAAFNAAIAAAAPSGGTVYVPPGTFDVQSTYNNKSAYKPFVQLASGVKLKGAGVDKSIIKLAPSLVNVTYSGNGNFDTSIGMFVYTGDSTFNSVINAYNCSDVVVEDLTIDGNRMAHPGFNVTAYYPYPDINGLVFSNGTNNTAQRIRVINCLAGGVFFRSSANSKVILSELAGCGFGGVVSYGVSTNLLVDSNNVYDHDCDCVRISSHYATISNNQANASRVNKGPQANYAGIFTENAIRPTITGNTCTENSSYGIDVWNFSIQENASTGAIIEGNEIFKNGNGGIRLAQSYAQVIGGNKIYNNGRNSAGFSDPTVRFPYGVVIQKNRTGTQVKGNDITNGTYQTHGVGGETTLANTVVTNNNFSGGGTALHSTLTGGTGNTFAPNNYL